MSSERFVVTRTIAAPPAEVFAVLADPQRHQDTEPGDWVRDAVSREPITGAGQIFVINMFLEFAGGHYVMHNLVTDFEQDPPSPGCRANSTSRASISRAAGGGATT